MENYFDKIEDFIKGKLLPAEKILFEKQLLTNSDLARELELKKLESASYELLIEKKLKNKFSEWDLERKAEKKPTFFQLNPVRWAVAASVTLLVGLFIWKNNKPIEQQNNVLVKRDSVTIQPQKSTIDTSVQTKIAIQRPFEKGEQNTQKNPAPKTEAAHQIQPKNLPEVVEKNDTYTAIVEEFASPPDFDASIRGASRGSEQDSIFNKATKFLASEQFAKAIPILLTFQNDNEAKFYLGYAYFKTRSLEKALPIFETLSKNKNFDLAESAEWYLALTQLERGNRDMAFQSLNNMANDSEHTFNKRSIELLKKLEKY